MSGQERLARRSRGSDSRTVVQPVVAGANLLHLGSWLCSFCQVYNFSVSHFFFLNSKMGIMVHISRCGEIPHFFGMLAVGTLVNSEEKEAL